jgi:hypothetical protein
MTLFCSSSKSLIAQLDYTLLKEDPVVLQNHRFQQMTPYCPVENEQE